MKGSPAQAPMNDLIYTSLRDGAKVSISGGPRRKPWELVEVALRASWQLEGKPVRCADILPGIVMRVSAGTSGSEEMRRTGLGMTDVWTTLRAQLLIGGNAMPVAMILRASNAGDEDCDVTY